MRVIVSRTGGFAGVRVTWEVHVEAQPDRHAWRELVESMPWQEVPAVAAEPDRYVYRITCEPHEAVLSERALEGPWRVLVERVRSRSRGASGAAADPGEPREGTPSPDDAAGARGAARPDPPGGPDRG
ncbi:protealysin inhibitor emfourin [Microbacterium marinilacus]|uniref:Uncharacterized protein n=1 Tax=Microbacterium marinilacus TaxID=415209 RepID=A0ABP7B5V3_9MICO|nr:protealysin inhibitor emfourin [Microbacterium marinilacus]MBY0687766.1 hypothetical protein [Microbacterium marinilacus]